MSRFTVRWRFQLTTLGLYLISATVVARETGTDVLSCSGCHELGSPPMATLSIDSQQIEPGGTASFRLVVSSSNQVSGFAVKAPEGGGHLSFVDAATQREVKPGVISHVAPVPFVNGQAVWEFTFTTPLAVGVSELEVSTVAANGNGHPEDDGGLSMRTWVSHGCVAQEWFPDRDLDGYGDRDARPVPSCDAVPGRVANGLDCADDDASRNPDAVELCNFIDDNCDGMRDEGLNTAVLYPDADGDGYGVDSGAEPLVDCLPRAGFAGNFDDCDDVDPMRNPGAAEVCNGVDDNCDGEVDNGCIMTTDMPGSSGEPTPTPPVTTDATDGCTVRPVRHAIPLSMQLGVVAVGALFVWRRRRSRG